jgi:AcrR family transcriptional regulator
LKFKIDENLSLLTKTQRWDFSLREVARCADVSHNAPYSHFASKRDLLAAVAVKGYEMLQARALTAVRGKKKPADALKAIGIAYLRFAAENPAHYRLMFGPTLQGQDGGLPSEVIRAFGSAVNVLREVLKQGRDDRTFKIPQNDRAALETAVIADWSLVHGLTMLYIDGLATLENRANDWQVGRKSRSHFYVWARKARKTGLRCLSQARGECIEIF